MRRQDFSYSLPTELIAQHPPAVRGDSRLLCLDGATGAVTDSHISHLVQQLRHGDLMVFNDTRVLRARLLGAKPSGGRVEVLVERVLDAQRALAHVRASKAPKPGSEFTVGAQVPVRVLARHGDLFELEFADARGVLGVLEAEGRLPLPPYIERDPAAADDERYQTVFARVAGAVAAPTAGLHFTPDMLHQLAANGVQFAYVTLHVGAGTFQPVRSERIEDHHMHREYLDVSSATVEQIAAARARGGRVVAVGTTVVRALESAARAGTLRPFQGDTDIFIYPGYRFRVVDALLTNFHLPESTLLMLVCAFGGFDAVLAAYRHAVAQRYRFFSYGDAMWLTPQASAREKESDT